MKHSLYKKIYGGISSFVQRQHFLKKALPVLNVFLTVLFFAAYGSLYLYAVIKKVSAVALMDLTLPIFLTLFVVTVLRWTIPRPRPYSEEGAGITPLVQKKKTAHNSFPSRHIACAAVISCAFFSYFPLASIIFFQLALLLAGIRFILGLHYLSDLLVGGGIGLFFGLAVLIL